MRLQRANKNFKRGDYVMDFGYETFFVFDRFDSINSDICHVYGIALNPGRDKVIPLHAWRNKNMLVLGKETDVDPEGELAIIKNYITKGQSLINVVEERSLPYLKKKGSLRHPFPYTL